MISKAKYSISSIITAMFMFLCGMSIALLGTVGTGITGCILCLPLIYVAAHFTYRSLTYRITRKEP